MLRRIAAPITVAAALLAFPSFAAAQDTPAPAPTPCSGTLSDQIIAGDVTVARGQNCTLDGVVVRGNVVTARRSTGLSIVGGSLVKGNVTCADCGTFSLDKALVKGAVSVTETRGGAKICRSAVNGAVTIAFTFNVTVGDGTSACRGNAFIADVTLQNNSTATTANGNVLNANLTVNANRNATVSRNVVRGNLGCENNLPAPTLSQNVVLGEETGQCAPAPAV